MSNERMCINSCFFLSIYLYFSLALIFKFIGTTTNRDKPGNVCSEFVLSRDDLRIELDVLGGPRSGYQIVRSGGVLQSKRGSSTDGMGCVGLGYDVSDFHLNYCTMILMTGINFFLEERYRFCCLLPR